MAHPAQQDFCLRVKALLPGFFERVKVVDFGSLDINGNNRELFDDSHYVGVDLYSGKNVDVVMQAHCYQPDEAPDVVISTEMLEHDVDWELSLQQMLKVLKPGGLLLVTCATTGRPEHGTRRTSPTDSPGTPNYYQNLTEDDFKKVLDMDQFSDYFFAVNHKSADLYFWGVKRVDLPDLRQA